MFERDSGFCDISERRLPLKAPELPPRRHVTMSPSQKRTLPNAMKPNHVVEEENIYNILEQTTKYKERSPKQSSGHSLRCFLIDEIIENETKFKNEMARIISLLSSGDVEIPITSEDLRLIFINLREYLTISREIINAIKNAKEDTTDPEMACVAGAFLPLIVPFKKVYVDYIKLFDPQLVQKRPHLEMYFEVASALLTERDGNTVTLSDRLLAPFQRPFKISNVFERMKKV
uniref:RhoGEF domain n=2 Tax=Schistocephalus solidus TaxID=70667 RepID=A0A0X3PEH7_SCHSO